MAGNISGQILLIQTEKFEVVRDYQAHAGVIHAIAIHPSLPYAASIGTDHTLAIWQLDADEGLLELISMTSVRDVICTNDTEPVDAVVSHSVALGFHGTQQRVVTRSGNGGVMEAAFDDVGQLTILSCVRMHEDWDVQMARYVVGSDYVLSAGRDGHVVLSSLGRVVCKWKLFGDEVCHWIEFLEEDTYLIASDAGRVGRLDLSDRTPPVIGDRFARDDMEFISYNAVSKRAFATSFDRGVYEIDPNTCQSLGHRYSPGYKCVWAKSLLTEPSSLIVHSRNGGLYKADIDTGDTLGEINECPPALWSFVRAKTGDLIGAGEGSGIVHVSLKDVDPMSRVASYEYTTQETAMPLNSYSKRIAYHPDSNRLYFGRTSGELWTGHLKGKTVQGLKCIFDAKSAIRDIVLDETGKALFLVTEDGMAAQFNTETHEVEARFQTDGEPFAAPLWALAYNPDRRLLAVADRGSIIYILNVDDFSVAGTCPARRVKRMKWLDSDRLLYGDRDKIMRLDVVRQVSDYLVPEGLQNSVEDFIWDGSGRYLLAISYQCIVALCDLQTGVVLDIIRDRMDYSKGLAWVPADNASAYPWDFVTWGRAGSLQHYRLHEEGILPIGPVQAAQSR
ncbi:WD40 repeat domain-containing protein [Leisingera caerulea]|uniref:WD40 repeat domain-containing protein n=1 Tax=Leisingera caerulea TaxID=506591 RepID=UPI0021A712F6|nr:WD40 repeat domain-containing protein [Leisingera caerulea]UWQ49917.1 WD40 repeat domain-containing protein [Leisingera caerulea]